MTFYYLETSGLLKRYRSELGSSVVDQLFNGKRPDEEFVTSHLTVVEVTAVASRMLKGRLLRRSQYDNLVGRLVRDITDYRVTVLPLEERVSVEALDLYPEYALRAPDALHFVSAMQTSRAVHPEPVHVVSADREVGEACQRYGLPLLNPESPSAASALAALR